MITAFRYNLATKTWRVFVGDEEMSSEEFWEKYGLKLSDEEYKEFCKEYYGEKEI